MGGNRITLMRFDVPVGEADPAARIRAIHQRTGERYAMKGRCPTHN